MIGFGCPSCGQALAVAQQDGGTIGWCPQCRAPYIAPREGEAVTAVRGRMTHQIPPPPPISIPKPLLALLFVIAGVILAGSLYAIVDSSRSHYRPQPRAQKANPSPAPVPAPAPAPPPKSVPEPARTRPEADVNGQPWTFDPPPRMQNPSPLTVSPLKIIPTEETYSVPEYAGGSIYFGTDNGNVYAVNPQTFELEKHQLGYNFYGFWREGPKLRAAFKSPTALVTLAEFNEPIDGDQEFVRPVERTLGGYQLPNDWIMPSPTVYFKGRYYSCADASVKVLDKGVASTYASKLKNLWRWKIALLPTGPAGYDNGGVFELDEHLCPIKRVINLRNYPEFCEETVGSFLASDGRTLCFVSSQDKTTRMQIWSLDGRTKLREIVVDYQPRTRNSAWPGEKNRIIAVGGGYVFSGFELMWLSADERPPMTFGAPRRLYDLSFTPAVVANNRIFVGRALGGLYVFDIASFASPQEPGGLAVTR